MKVHEVIAFLQQFPPEQEVMSAGPDCGGYDCVLGSVNKVENRQGVPCVYYSEYSGEWPDN